MDIVDLMREQESDDLALIEQSFVEGEFEIMKLAPNGKAKVSVQLVGQDGNAFAVMGRCSAAMKREGWSEEEIKAFRHECMSQHSYDDLLSVVLDYCDDEAE